VRRKLFPAKGLAVLALLVCIFAQQALALESFSIVVLPDTQRYSEYHPEIFTAQTRWIAENAEKLNIVFVSHEGDIVDNWDSEEQWKNASESLSLLDGVVPYGVLPGNHDLGGSGSRDFFNQYFPPARFSHFPWYGGSFPPGKNNNSYQLFSASGIDFLALHLGFCPSDETISWANLVLKANPGRMAMITTHGYLNEKGERRIYGCEERDGNMEYLWGELIYPNPNVFLVLCGHIHSETARADPNIEGKDVFQLLADYQDEENGGNGFLRILTFSPEEKRVFVKTYSPYLDSFKTGGKSSLVLELELPEKPKEFNVLLFAGLALGLILFLAAGCRILRARK